MRFPIIFWDKRHIFSIIKQYITKDVIRWSLRFKRAMSWFLLLKKIFSHWYFFSHFLSNLEGVIIKYLQRMFYFKRYAMSTNFSYIWIIYALLIDLISMLLIVINRILHCCWSKIFFFAEKSLQKKNFLFGIFIFVFFCAFCDFFLL